MDRAPSRTGVGNEGRDDARRQASLERELVHNLTKEKRWTKEVDQRASRSERMFKEERTGAVM